MRKDILVSYDISDDTRLRKVYQLMRGHGQWLQYSVFRCELSDQERFKLMAKLTDIINQKVDQVMFVDLGPAGDQNTRFETLGRPMDSRPRGSIVL